MADGDYGFDPNIQDVDYDIDENIAWAATSGYAAPDSITADKVFVDGTQLRLSPTPPTPRIKSNPVVGAGFLDHAASVGQPDAGDRLFRRHRS